jgi:HK97 family phage prohead protease
LQGSLGFLTNSKVVAKAAITLKSGADTSSSFIIPDPGANTLAGYPMAMSNLVPSNIVLQGYAATFGVEAKLPGDVTEVLASGAFAASLRNDVLAFVDHDPGRLLARTKSGTLRLAEDSKGLQFDLDVPSTTVGNDVLALAERGDLGGMSFGFVVGKDGEEWDGNKRTLRSVDLREISVVSAWPAYEGTVVDARARKPEVTSPICASLLPGATWKS